MSVKTPRMYRDRWARGETAYFEYHCLQAHYSCDAELWYRSHQPVTVLRMVERGYGKTLVERGELGHPKLYRIRFADGYEWDAFEDELLTSARHYEPQFRPGRRP